MGDKSEAADEMLPITRLLEWICRTRYVSGAVEECRQGYLAGGSGKDRIP